MPLIAIDAQRDIDLDVLDAPQVPRYLPGELGVGGPRGAHGEEGRVRHRLRVGCYAVVLFGGQDDGLGGEGGEDALHEGKAGRVAAVRNKD